MYEELLKRHPDWKNFARSKEDSDGPAYEHSLQIEIPCPNPKVKYGLTISTDEGELTIAFNYCHQHFSDVYSQNFDEPISNGSRVAR